MLEKAPDGLACGKSREQVYSSNKCNFYPSVFDEILEKSFAHYWVMSTLFSNTLNFTSLCIIRFPCARFAESINISTSSGSTLAILGRIVFSFCRHNRVKTGLITESIVGIIVLCFNIPRLKKSPVDALGNFQLRRLNWNYPSFPWLESFWAFSCVISSSSVFARPVSGG